MGRAGRCETEPRITAAHAPGYSRLAGWLRASSEAWSPCQANQAAAAANAACHSPAGSGLNRGSNIPAMAMPMRICTPSASNSVCRRRTLLATMRPADSPASRSIRAAKPAGIQAGPVTSASLRLHTKHLRGPLRSALQQFAQPARPGLSLLLGHDG